MSRRDVHPDLARLDAAYASFPPFSSWAGARLDRVQWEYWAGRLRDERARATEERFARTRERALRVAAIDTGAIEGLYSTDRGFTMTVSAMAERWTLEVESRKGRDVRETVAAQRAAFDLALDVVTGSSPLSESWVRRVHEVACAAQETYDVYTAFGPQEQPLPKGVYKTYPNHFELADGSLHAYAPVDRVGDEMHRLLDELRSPSFEQAHAVVQAAYAHHALTTIHPFADGNGRVARVLASVFLLRAESIPFVVFADQTAPYLRALEAADQGRSEQFVRFVFDRALDTLALMTELLDDGEGVTAAADALRRTIDRAAAAGEVELDVAAHSVVDLAVRATQELLQRHVPAGLSAEVVTFHTSPSAEVDGFRAAADGLGGFVVRITGADPVTVGLQVDVQLVIDARSSAPFAVRLRSLEPDLVPPLDVRLSEVHPRPTTSLQMRVSRWAERLVSAILASIDRQVRGWVRR